MFKKAGGGAPNLLAAELNLGADDLVPPFACGIAWEPARIPVTTICAHVFEKQSLVQWYSLHGREPLCGKCPICAHDISNPEGMKPDPALEAAAQKARAAAAAKDAAQGDIEDGAVKINKKDKSNKLGRGGFGTVWKGVYQGQAVAVKVVNDADEEEEAQALRREWRILRSLQHPNIIKLIGSTVDEDDNVKLVMELLGESVRKRISKAPPALTERGGPLGFKDYFTLAKGAARGLAFLHEKGVVHSDIKADNLLVPAGPISPVGCKISDFGLVRAMRSSMKSVATSKKGVGGTAAYKAPELLLPGASNSKESDMFALGMTFWEMLTGKIPFQGAEEIAIAMAIKDKKRETIPAGTPEPLSELIQACWAEAPKRRPTAMQALLSLHVAEKKLVKSDIAPAIRTLLKDGEELRRVVKAAKKGFALTNGAEIMVEKVWKVQNSRLEGLYDARCAELHESREVQLFHGTSQEVVQAICDVGFRVPEANDDAFMEPEPEHDDEDEDEADFAVEEGEYNEASEATVSVETAPRATAGLKFGRGIYFTEDARKGVHYAEERGSQMLILSDVCLGKSKSLRKSDPSMTLAKLNAQGYDSLSLENPSAGVKMDEVVVYHPHQAVARYILQYRKIKVISVKWALDQEHHYQSSQTHKSPRLSRDQVAQHVQKLLDASGHASETNQMDEPLQALGSFCRDYRKDDGRPSARLLDARGDLWNMVLRTCRENPNEVVQWACLRLLHNYAKDSAVAQESLQRYQGCLHVATCLNKATNEGVLQKAAIALCNMSSECPAALQDDSGRAATIALAGALERAGQDMSRIYVVCALRNFVSVEVQVQGTIKQILSCMNNTSGGTPLADRGTGVLDTLLYSANRLDWWLKGMLQFFENLTQSLSPSQRTQLCKTGFCDHGTNPAGGLVEMSIAAMRATWTCDVDDNNLQDHYFRMALKHHGDFITRSFLEYLFDNIRYDDRGTRSSFYTTQILCLNCEMVSNFVGASGVRIRDLVHIIQENTGGGDNIKVRKWAAKVLLDVKAKGVSVSAISGSELRRHAEVETKSRGWDHKTDSIGRQSSAGS